MSTPRLQPGERRLQILQALADMLQAPGGERVTTAALAARLGVSEAALYRHFASKAQMFDALIEFIETSVLGLIQQVTDRELAPLAQTRLIVTLLFQFAEKNPGMARVMAGDALVLEHERLMARMELFWDKFESALKQRLREAQHPHAVALAGVLSALAQSRLQRYARSGWRRPPSERLPEVWSLFFGDLG